MRISAMKKTALLSVLVFCTTASAQQAPPAQPSADRSAVEVSRMKTLEDQVRTLAEEVALLRGELRALRDVKSVELRAGERILLTSSPVEPGMLPAAAASPASPDPVPSQLAHTQTYGGATSNATPL